ncbi:MAG: HupE/UreJ family protein [Sandaracinaceae bacterium]
MRWTVALGALVVLTTSGSATAHAGSTKLVWIELEAEGARMRVDLDPIDVAYAIDLDDPDHADAERALDSADAIRGWVERSMSLRAGDADCAAEAGSVTAVDVEGALRMSRAVRVEVRFECGSPPTRFVDHAVFADDPQHEAIVRIGERVDVLRVGRQELSLEDPGLGATFGEFLLHGALHMTGGLDHVLFLLSLLLLAGERAARDGARPAAREVAIIVTAFTVGHSITLIAAALDLVTLPSRFVESAIAASIVFVAIWNLTRPDRSAELRWVAGVFGLVHGFGFSSVLRELALPRTERITALVAFNLGIELAQLAIVVIVVPLFGYLARRAWYRRVVVRGGSIVIALVATYWLIQRALFA